MKFVIHIVRDSYILATHIYIVRGKSEFLLFGIFICRLWMRVRGIRVWGLGFRHFIGRSWICVTGIRVWDLGLRHYIDRSFVREHVWEGYRFRVQECSLFVCECVRERVCESVRVWECESVRVWECESVRVWECESVGVWERAMGVCDGGSVGMRERAMGVWECENVIVVPALRETRRVLCMWVWWLVVKEGPPVEGGGISSV